MSNFHPIVGALAADVTNSEMLPIAVAASVLRGLRRTLDKVTGAIDNVEDGPTAEEECRVQKCARGSQQTAYDKVPLVVGRIQAKRRWIGFCEIQAGGRAGSMGNTNGLLCRNTCVDWCSTCVEFCSHTAQRSKRQTV